ncbi:MAG: hypothetical protein HYT70_01955 [Candidatus Aenigmarchaeota archaeon]|nr:hypothetical protein [Candidatus Aenigmarchaeota archaeon]
MEDQTILVETFGHSPVIRIIDFFLDNPLSDYSKEEAIRHSGISRITFYKYFHILEKNGIFKKTREVGKATMYTLDEKNEVVKALKSLEWTLGIKAMERSIEESSISVPVRKSVKRK